MVCNILLAIGCDNYVCNVSFFKALTHNFLHSPGKTSHAAVGRIALTMCLAAGSGGITQCIISGLVQMYNRHEHYNTNEIANAVLANLVAVTGCCPFIAPPWAILIGREGIYTALYTLLCSSFARKNLLVAPFFSVQSQLCCSCC